MDIIPDRCWQIAAGDANRNYADICLRNGVVIVGPGYCGNWLIKSDDGKSIAKEILRKDKWASRKITNIERFIIGEKL